jgi:hypothetical protein
LTIEGLTIDGLAIDSPAASPKIAFQVCKYAAEWAGPTAFAR